MSAHLAIDLGAESGRMVLGALDEGRLTLREVHRFPNRMLRMGGHWRWNVYGIYEEILAGLRKCSDEGIEFESIGVDSWGVDFCLLAKDGSLLGLPVTYRDDRTEGAMERFFERVPPEIVYAKTGIQFMRLNTLYQLFSMTQAKSPLLDSATDLLFIPDLFHFLLCNEKRTEFSFATTSQLYNLHEKQWDKELIDAAGIDRSLFQEVCPPGTVLGSLSDDVRLETGLGQISVVAPGSHDTASAVAAVPAEGNGWAYISSGTWSLMGIEIAEPICSEEARRLNFTNEGGVGMTYRFLKNIMGLWLVQGLRKEFGETLTYDELGRMAEEAPPFAALVDPDDESFYNPTSMKESFDTFCARSNQRIQTTPGAYVRCALESLALRYRQVLDELRTLHDGPISTIHVVGGGSRNDLLCQFTANALQLPVMAGPAEATAIGNVLVQAQAQGHVASVKEIREIVARSFEPRRFEPTDTDQWQTAYGDFRKLLGD